MDSTGSRRQLTSPTDRARAVRHAAYAVALVASPLLLFVGTLLNPAVGGIGAGATNIARNAAANPALNQVHIGLYLALTFLLPAAMLGLIVLAIPRAPWLGTIGGALGLIGWLPWAALVAQDDLTFRMAQAGGGAALVALWNGFTTDWAMGTLTWLYVACHLLAFVLLGVALARSRVIPPWAAWALVLTSPVTMVAFPTHQPVLLHLAAALLFAGSVPAALAVWRRREWC
jgi:hypothetical protein